MTKALHIPADWQKPVEVFDLVDDESGQEGLKQLWEKIFPGEIAERVQGMTVSSGSWGVGPDGLQIISYFDDEGLYNTPNEINIRAMATMLGIIGRAMHSMVTPLVGEFVVTAMDPKTGDQVDLPEDLIKDIQSLFTQPWVQVTDMEGNSL